MKKRSQERQMPTDQDQTPETEAPQAAPAPTTETIVTGIPPALPPPEAPPPVIKTCGICERPLPCPLHDKPVPALANLEDGAPPLKALVEEMEDVPEQEKFDHPPASSLEELHERIRAARVPPPAYVPPPPTERQQVQINAEMAAGRRASERAAAQMAARPVRQSDPTEGTNTPVHRPGNVDEYRPGFRSQVQTKSKDAR